jgi:cysteine desulfurase
MPAIYLDYNSTTPIGPAIRAAMRPFLGPNYGNASSAHELGRASKAAIDVARSQVAAILNATPEEIIFTGGGSEANNFAIKGLAFSQEKLAHCHFITSAVEHPSATKPLRFLERMGCKLTLVPVDSHGQVNPDDVRRAINKSTVLISVMHSNNEVGTLQPIKEIAAIAKEHGVVMHTDAAQSVGKLTIDVNELGVDLLSVAGHKLYAPKGVGALFVRRNIKLEPLIHGAGQESGRRAGTENVPYIVGLGAACEVAQRALPGATQRLQALRDRLWKKLNDSLGDRVVLNGHPTERLPNTLNVSFIGRTGGEILAGIEEIAASTGSACDDGKNVTSPVLEAMGASPEVCRGAIRLSVGRFTSNADVDKAAEFLVARAR